MRSRESRIRRGAVSSWTILAALFGSSLLLLACATSAGPEDDLLGSAVNAPVQDTEVDPHLALFVENRFPSATECRACHEDHYREWSVSQHAYAQLSPIFNAMQGRMGELMNGTLGDFCIRCHTPVGMALEEPVFTANAHRHPVSLEGITCIVCHRVDDAFGKVSGRRSLVTGRLEDPVLGPTGGEELARVIESDEYFVNPGEEGRRGAPIHANAKKFFQLVEPAFCGACHDVTLPNGFRLEEAFSEFRGSPAAERGESCQDCHMGTEPGVAGTYRTGPAAVVEGVPTRERRLTNHMFVGPDASIVHPGIFPHNPEAQALATLEEWLTFDVDAGWGTDTFEDELPEELTFPPRWRDADDRIEAREILMDQQDLLAEAKADRLKLLQRGYLLGELSTRDEGGLAFEVPVKNGTDAHNVPTGFTAERLVWLEVTVMDAAGEVVFRSGDLDPNGDVRDLHSLYVHAGELPLDDQLFSLQSKFLTRNLRGGEREQVLAINHSVDALPFLRPDTTPTILEGRPNGARIHKQGIEPGGQRMARYRVPDDVLESGAEYRVRLRLKAAMVPANLIGTVASVGFDYGLSAREVARRVVREHLVLHDREHVVRAR